MVNHMNVRTIATWVLTVVLALAFLAAGFAKVSSAPMMVAQFTAFGYPLWFMYVTGVIELASAILVVVPRFAAVGAGLIVCVMIGAVVSLLSHGQAAMVGAPVVLFILAVIVGTLRGWGGVRSLRRA
jgi:uncharacterized membrane protein YphA (DoxX/SURF4 family)